MAAISTRVGREGLSRTGVGAEPAGALTAALAPLPSVLRSPPLPLSGGAGECLRRGGQEMPQMRGAASRAEAARPSSRTAAAASARPGAGAQRRARVTAALAAEGPGSCLPSPVTTVLQAPPRGVALLVAAPGLAEICCC